MWNKCDNSLSGGLREKDAPNTSLGYAADYASPAEAQVRSTIVDDLGAHDAEGTEIGGDRRAEGRSADLDVGARHHPARRHARWVER